MDSNKTRVCLLRIGIVLSVKSGLINTLKKSFQNGLGIIIGDGSQHFSFIHINDLTGIVMYMIENKEEKGVYNVVAHYWSTNLDFTLIFAEALNRKIRLRIPEFVFTLIFGEVAAVVTGGRAVYPRRVLESGYIYKYPTLEAAIADIVN